jgi:plastocyanin
MRRWLALTLAVASGALLCTATARGPFGITAVHAAQTWNVVAGGDGDQIPSGGSLTSIGFFPSVVTINAGDTISWTFPSS